MAQSLLNPEQAGQPQPQLSLEERFPSGYYAPTSFGREEKKQNNPAAR